MRNILLKAYWALEGIAVVMLTLNLFFGWFYSFDSNNLYSRGKYYHLTHVAALVVVLFMLIRYHGRFSKKLKFLADDDTDTCLNVSKMLKLISKVLKNSRY